LRCFSLFSGIGGFDLAAKSLGHTIVGACEIDKYAEAIYTKHFPNITIHKDATKIKPEKLPDFDILLAGFPCQSFSIAGKRRGFEDARGTLFFEIIRIAQKKRPRHLLLENVKGLLSHENGNTARKIFCTLDELGYDTQSSIINTKDFLPQNRERIFIVSTLGEKSRREIFPVTKNDRLSDKKKQGKQKQTRIRSKICSSIDARYGALRNSGETYIITPCITGGAHSGGMHSDMLTIISDEYQQNRVYHPSGISQTILANSGGLGAKTGLYTVPVQTANRINEKQCGRQIKNNGDESFSLLASQPHGIFDGKKIRRLTPTECEKLQGFPINHTKFGIDESGNEIEISDTQRYKCLGNAVSVPVAQHVLKMVMST